MNNETQRQGSFCVILKQGGRRRGLGGLHAWGQASEKKEKEVEGPLGEIGNKKGVRIILPIQGVQIQGLKKKKRTGAQFLGLPKLRGPKKKHADRAATGVKNHSQKG